MGESTSGAKMSRSRPLDHSFSLSKTWVQVDVGPHLV